jgi:rRNA-processing protein EBP2
MQNIPTPSNACPTPSKQIVITSPSPEKAEKNTPAETKPKRQERQKTLNYKEELKEINQSLKSKYNSRFSKDPTKEAPLVEHQSIIGGDTVKLSTELDIKLEIQREAQFFNAALANSKQVLIALENLGVKLERPKDFYAEMFKSDAHMEKVANRIEREKKRIEDFETKKKQKQNVKFHKRLKHKRQLEAAKEKKEGLKQIEKWKQRIRKGDTNAELKFKESNSKGYHGFVNQKTRKRGNKGKKRLGKSRRISKKIAKN